MKLSRKLQKIIPCRREFQGFVVGVIEILSFLYCRCFKIMYQNTPFDVFFLGMIHEVNLGGGDNIRDPDVQLIDKVEEAQVRYICY